jgi:hypothetical protein
MEDLKSQVFNLVKIKGPIIPVQISKSVNSNILFTSAILSELVSNRQVYVSNLKIGGSPLYYVLGQEFKLQNFIHYLSGVHRKAYDLIRDKKILTDSKLEPWQRVALREIEDFAVQFNSNGTNEVFWKWYLLKDEEIKNFLDLKEKVEQKPEVKKEAQQILVEEPKILKQEEILVEEPKIIKEEKKKIVNVLTEDAKKYFLDNQIELIKEEVIKKNKEINYEIKIDTTVGNINFFSKIKSKKKISDSDLSLAINEAKNKPILFLSDGELTKKAKEFIEKKFENTLLFRKI